MSVARSSRTVSASRTPTVESRSQGPRGRSRRRWVRAFSTLLPVRASTTVVSTSSPPGSHSPSTHQRPRAQRGPRVGQPARPRRGSPPPGTGGGEFPGSQAIDGPAADSGKVPGAPAPNADGHLAAVRDVAEREVTDGGRRARLDLVGRDRVRLPALLDHAQGAEPRRRHISRESFAPGRRGTVRRPCAWSDRAPCAGKHLAFSRGCPDGRSIPADAPTTIS